MSPRQYGSKWERFLARLEKAEETEKLGEPAAPGPVSPPGRPETELLRQVAARHRLADETEQLAEPVAPAPLTRPAPPPVEPIPVPPPVERIPAPPRVEGIPAPPRAKRIRVPFPPRWWQRYGPELLVAVLLGTVAFLARRHGLPTDGVWHDDSTPAAGLKDASSLSQLFAVSTEHPGFIAALIGWSHLTGGSDASLAYPALIAGTLGPPLLYLALRGCGYERSISVLLGAALAAVQTDIIYSGRIRTYTTDVLIVLGLAMIIPRLTRMRWRWRTGLAWVAATAVLASFSGFALVAVAVAGAILVLHSRSDLQVRALAVGAQAAACAALLIAEGHSYSLSKVRGLYDREWDAFPTFHLNPFRFGAELLEHLRRLLETFPGGPGWLATLCIAAVLIGLVTAAREGRPAIRARYLLLLFVVALLGGVMGRLPFGPKQVNTISDGGRVSLWLIPVLALGLAASLQGLRGRLADRRRLRVGFDAAAYLATAALLVSAVTATQPPYPFPGAKSATDFVELHLGPRDSLLVGYHAHWSLAAESNFASDVQPISDSPVGFQPDFADPRVHYLDVGLHAEQSLGPELVNLRQVAPEVEHADRIFVYYAMPEVELPEKGARAKLASTLRGLGFKQKPTRHFGAARVEAWRRGGRGAPAPAEPAPSSPEPTAADRINVRTSDLPRGWRKTLPPANPPATGIFACLHVPTVKTSETVVKAASADAKRSAVFDVTLWPSSAAVHRAFNAFSGPDAAGCIESALHSDLVSFGLAASVTAKEVPPPPTGGAPAVAYAETVRASNRTTQFALEGPVVFFINGTASVMISSASVGGPFPPNILSSLVATLADRVSTATLPNR